MDMTSTITLGGNTLINIQGRRVFVTSDTHFGHMNIIRYCGRPFTDAQEMNNEIVARWNSTVTPEDLVIHCGDFALSDKSNLNLVSKLNGHKVLILGNHDHWSRTAYRAAGFEDVYGEYVYVRYNEQVFCFSHHPICADKINPHIQYYFGHVHNSIADIETYNNVKCICVERTNYTPVCILDATCACEAIMTFLPHNLSPNFDYQKHV